MKCPVCHANTTRFALYVAGGCSRCRYRPRVTAREVGSALFYLGLILIIVACLVLFATPVPTP